MILTICIPTYNRINDLLYNLRILKEIIEKNHLHEEICIIISDNCSPDHTLDILTKELLSCQHIKITVYSQESNIGGPNNSIFTISKASTDFCMLLGDDDYLNADYVSGVLAAIKNNNDLTCIFPSYQAIYPNKEIINGLGRDLKCKTKYYQKGFITCYKNFHRAHQLSGLTFKKGELVEQYKEKKMDNLYPQAFFMMKNCLNGVSLHMTDYPVLVTHVEQSKKDWSYGKDCLIVDKFQNCVNLDLSYLKCTLMEIITIIDTKYLLREFGYKVIPEVILEKDTKIIAGLFLVFYIPYILLEKCVKKIYWKFFK